MSDVLIRPALIAAGGLSARARRAYTARRHGDRDAGVSTLEMVIITLGLIAVATLLVTAITLAVTRRTDQIK
jgi:protein involved in polysaccharide export with SLBB domain